jgi:hypothetical protein
VPESGFHTFSHEVLLSPRDSYKRHYLQASKLRLIESNNLNKSRIMTSHSDPLRSWGLQ